MQNESTKSSTSYRMSKVPSKDTKPELVVRKFLFAKGLRYRLANKHIIGNPDIAIQRYKIAIFVHGCFWHGHINCKRSSVPKSNTAFWQEKIKYNMDRDVKNLKRLEDDGWHVFVVWECRLGKKTREEEMLELFQAISVIKESI